VLRLHPRSATKLLTNSRAYIEVIYTVSARCSLEAVASHALLIAVKELGRKSIMSGQTPEVEQSPIVRPGTPPAAVPMKNE
jgi:hypothetical protein